MIQDVNQALADSFGLDGPKGALVASVEAGSPASRAGIQSGDVVTKFNGHDIGRSSELPTLVAGTAPGSDATIEVWRQGKAKELHITVGEMKSLAAQDKGDELAEAASPKLGLAVRPLREGEKTGIEGGRGLLVENVKQGPAAQSGIQPGDVILAVNGARVASVEQLSEQLGKAGKRLALLIQRGERTMFVPITIG
jgi:serine protease Do